MKFDVPGEVINHLFEQGYEEQIIDIVMAFENGSNREVSDIPLSPIILKDSGESIIFSSDVFQEYYQLVERIRNQTTAQEIPFFLLGNPKVINGQEYLFMEKIQYDLEDGLSELKVTINEKAFKELVVNSPYEIISIGHTHGNVSLEKKQETLTWNLPTALKETYAIRDVGLNLSLADIWQHEAFKQLADSYKSKRILQTIIMYNGDVIILDNHTISKSNSIQALTQDKQLIMLPTAFSDTSLKNNYTGSL